MNTFKRSNNIFFNKFIKKFFIILSAETDGDILNKNNIIFYVIFAIYNILIGRNLLNATFKSFKPWQNISCGLIIEQKSYLLYKIERIILKY